MQIAILAIAVLLPCAFASKADLDVDSDLSSSAKVAQVVNLLNQQVDAVTSNTEDLIDMKSYSYWRVMYYEASAYYYWPSCSISSSENFCLSYIFKEIETYISSIEASLKVDFKKIVAGEKAEHYYLSAQTSFLYDVEVIADEVSSAVHVVEYSLYEQMLAGIDEEKRLAILYSDLVAQVGYIDSELASILSDKVALSAQYYSIMAKNLVLKSKISALIKAKSVVLAAEAQVSDVISKLYDELYKMNAEFYAMYRRQEILVHWEDVLVSDISDLNDEIREFKKVEGFIMKREYDLYKREGYLKVNLENIVAQAKLMKGELYSLSSQRVSLEAYLKEVVGIYVSVEKDVHSFSVAYSEFSCQESFLYAQCAGASSTHKAAAVV